LDQINIEQIRGDIVPKVLARFTKKNNGDAMIGSPE